MLPIEIAAQRWTMDELMTWRNGINPPLFGWFGGADLEKFTKVFDKVSCQPAAFWVALRRSLI